MQFQHLLDPVMVLAKQAGQAIMEVYARVDHEVVDKADASPLTAADLAAHHIIVAGLQKLNPQYPILSEEAAGIGWEQRQQWRRYWLVDPLDGTREFIQRNGDFTVNIALIDDGVPVLGVVFAPVLGWLYCGVQGQGAHKYTQGTATTLNTAAITPDQQTLRVVASRNHRGEALDDWIATMQQRFPALDTVSMGSSLKICLVAEGQADIYPRLAPTSEWDTAAAQAVLEAAGGVVLDSHGQALRYNRKESLLNPFFFAVGDKTLEFPKPDLL